MRLILGNIFSIVVSLGSFAACSDAAPANTSDAGLHGSSGGSTGILQSSGGTGGQGGSGTQSTAVGLDAGVTAGCPVFPKEKLFPFIGTRFYGPDPGPCTMRFINGTTVTFVYDSANLPTKGVSNDGSLDMLFTYDGDLITREVDSMSSAEAITDFQYASGSVGYTYSGTSPYSVAYTLDERGYPQTAALAGTASPNWPTRYVYRYKGCQMQDRIAYNADGTENDHATLHYGFDTAGHFVRQVSTDGSTDTTLDYSCW